MRHAVARVKSALGGEVRPLDLLLAVMRNEAVDARIRLKAAKAVAPYVHRKQRAERRQTPIVAHSVPIVFSVRYRDD